jgi:pseudouridine synthase
VRTKGNISEKDLRRMEKGIRNEGEILKAEAVRQTGECTYEFILNEGRKREIRRLTAACGAPTLRLIRVQIGDVQLGDLAAGNFRELTPEEIAGLWEQNDE